ncbi:glycosyltransferase [Mesorhizobium sp. B2-7-3]|uniref:glycosyltransferase family protein n=1 Tax=Mesorhizobium sp. B2-7-3 TaxID=2589907 RepID=UPI001127B401|nr:glycosyltransferase [Mesorhizobium sp. B2-7-3]TPJ13656.1 glycosyltransferase [Mesorhizobium sp. B2-7-3]
MSSLSFEPARLFTAFGTVIYVEPFTGELRHGPLESSPPNAFFERGDRPVGASAHGRLIHAVDGSAEPISCYSGTCFSISQSQSESQAVDPTVFELIPLERGLLALKSAGLFLSAIPDGQMKLSALVCSTWELFIASENWCTESSGGLALSLRDPTLDRRAIEGYVIHPVIRMNSNRRPHSRKILIYGHANCSHGRIYYDICKHLHNVGYICDMLDCSINHIEYIQSIIPYYDMVISALDGVSRLVDVYRVPYEKIIALSHHEFDIRLLIEQKGINIFEKFANYGVVSEYVYCASVMRGVLRPPMVASLGVNYDEFYTAVSERLTTVGYASTMSAMAYGVEWKRGRLAKMAALDAGLVFKVPGSTSHQISFHDMPNFYQSVDAVVMSSINESGPLSVLEGAAAGRLVIGTPVGHFPIKAAQGGGILAPVEPQKFKEFTAATLRFYRDNPSAYVEKCRSIQLAARKFDWEYTIAEWVELIESAQSSSAGKRKAHRHMGEEKGNHALHKAVICDMDWLSSYLADEHGYLIGLLNELYDFDIIDSSSTNFSDEETLKHLNSYSALLVAYQGKVPIPLDRISAYKLLKVDDLVSYDSGYDELLNYLISSADTIISPYAYEFRNHFDHGSVVWVPYSSSLEGCKDHDRISFNEDPLPKILVSGSIAWDRPLRQYAASLNDSRIDVLGHPGYWNKYNENSNAFVKTKYYDELSKYLCCFCDGHSYRYVHLKNFEIASVGSLLLTDRLIEKEMNALGFVDYQTCIFVDKEDLLEKIEWITDERNRSAVDTIRKAGMRLARERHMTRHRALQINDLVNSCVEGIAFEKGASLRTNLHMARLD